MPYPQIISIPNNPELNGMAEVLPDLVYASEGRTERTLTVLLPWGEEDQPRPRRPLIVFVQGSTWTTPNRNYQLPQLARYAQYGHVVATIGHRDSTQGHPFPAYLQDVKTAIRFLRAHQAQLGIDPERICLFGTSSGGNAALLAALTPNDPRYETAEWADQSSAVSCAICCFAPTDMRALTNGQVEQFAQNPVFSGLLGSNTPEEVLRGMSPILEIGTGTQAPPILLAYGDADELVPFYQGEAMYRALVDQGCLARLIRVIGAPHEGSFWSNRLFGLFADFLREHL